MSTSHLPVDQPARDLISSCALDQTLFVEAGAGTGKTRHLVERVVSLVSRADPAVALREIAAITFTEAAAAELRDRTRESLERLADRSDDIGVRQRCRAALADTDAAAISTLHSFAQRILSEHPVEAGLPPHVEVLDEVSSQIDFEQRWIELGDQLLSDPVLEETLVRAVLLGIPLDPTHPRGASLKDVAAVFNQNWDRLDCFGPNPPDLPPLARQPLRAAIQAVLEASGACGSDDDLLAGHIEQCRDEMQQALGAGSDGELLAVLTGRQRWSCARGRQENWPDVGAVRAATEAAEQAAEEVLRGAVHGVLARLAWELARHVRVRADERAASGRLEFHDLLVLARRLLRTSPEARDSLKARYRRIMIDEFQDTDPIQIDLAVLIAASVEGVSDSSWNELTDRLDDDGRLFFVGDPKQSIYRFRRADLGLFLEARDAIGGDQTVCLVQNFRTVPTILDWINHMFGELMGGAELEDRRIQPRYTPLEAFRSEAGADHRVNLLGQPHEDASAADLREAEAADVALAVKAIRDEPERWPVFDDKTGEWRGARLSDVAILLPTRLSLPYLVDALDQHHLPYRADTGSLVYDTQEVRDLLAALRAIDDPTDEIALVATLRSPLFGCSDVELFEFVDAGGTWDFTRWQTRAPGSLGISHAVVRAMGYLAGLHGRRMWDEPSALLQRLMTDRCVFESAFAGGRPREVWRRLRLLTDQARRFTEAEGGGLRRYLAWAELQRAEGARVQEPLLAEPDDEAVRIMTIHGAKGLEFAITVLSGLTTEARGPRRGVKVHWEDGGPQIRLGQKLETENFDRLAGIEDEMDEHEKLRLLYVGLTRVRDHLFVAVHHKQGRSCFAEQVWRTAQDEMGKSCRLLDLGPPPATLVEPAAPLSESAIAHLTDAGPERESFCKARRALLDSQRGTGTVSATAIAAAISGECIEEGEESTEATDPVASEGVAQPAPTRPWRSGRSGTAVGRAVHGVLQSVDLAGSEGIDELAAVQAEAEGLAGGAAEVAALARSALAAAAVRSAVRSPRRWRELYVAAPIEGVLIEGYVDLVYERDDGALVIVDYKTDSVGKPQRYDDKMAVYQYQGAAYALALEQSTGREVAECVFVFCGASGATEMAVTDLREACQTVRRHLRDDEGSP